MGPTAPKASSPASTSDLSSSSTSSHLPPTSALAQSAPPATRRQWFEDASPWGGAIVPPEYLQVVALHLMREPHQPKTAPLRGVHGPACGPSTTSPSPNRSSRDRSYRVLEKVADKGRSGRTVFLTYEFEIFDGDRRVAPRPPQGEVAGGLVRRLTAATSPSGCPTRIQP